MGPSNQMAISHKSFKMPHQQTDPIHSFNITCLLLMQDLFIFFVQASFNDRTPSATSNLRCQTIPSICKCRMRF